MIYDISLKISYRYQSPVYAGRHLLRLTPLSLAGQQNVQTAGLTITPEPGERSRYTDFFQNVATEIVFANAHSEIDVVLKTRVERLDQPARQDTSGPLDDLPARLEAVRTLDPVSPLHFLGGSPRIRPNDVLRDYVLDGLPADVSSWQAVRLVGAAINADMVFDSSATSVETTHEEAFEARKGVCQDFTHIMIAALRSAGIPAGYVSGFLRTRPPPGKKRLEGADAMHAWVRAWCGPDVGWVEYDPTNAVDVGSDHVVVAYGRDYSDVSPVKGVLRSASGQVSSQAVDMVPLD